MNTKHGLFMEYTIESTQKSLEIRATSRLRKMIFENASPKTIKELGLLRTSPELKSILNAESNDHNQADLPIFTKKMTKNVPTLASQLSMFKDKIAKTANKKVNSPTTTATTSSTDPDISSISSSSLECR
ncbi:MAG: hypothetical protein P1U74_03660 [Legionellaceae bacterium]|nr:hypothetical protein [Legionellaceae bacterium]